MKIALIIFLIAIVAIGVAGALIYYYKLQPFKEELPEYEKVSIVALNYDLDKYVGKKVTVAGYYGHGKYYGEDEASFLILDYKRLLLDEPLLYGTWIRLDGNIPPEEYDGYIIQVTGVVKKYSEVYGGPSLYEIPLLTVEEYTVVSETEYSKINHFEDFRAGGFLQTLRDKVKDCDRVLIISGGIDKHNNHPRYKRNIKEKAEKLKAFGFRDEQIIIIYYDGNDFTVDGKNIDVKYRATKENIRNVIQQFLREMDPCCTLYIFVTDHGFGYDENQGDAWGAYKLKKLTGEPDPLDPRNGDPGKNYRESELVIDCRHLKARYKIYNFPTGTWSIDYIEHTKTYKAWKFEGGKWKLKAVGKDKNGDGKISEAELGINLDNNPGTDVKIDKSDLTGMDHYYKNFKLNVDGEKEYKIEYEGGRYKIKVKDAAGNWHVIGEDTNGDNIIKGVDLDDDGSKDDVFTFHESICLYNGEELWDYELAQWLKPLHDKGIHIYVEMGQCFGGGFIKNLEGIVDRIVTAADENRKAYADKDGRWSVFEHFFIQKLSELTAEGWDEAFRKAVEEDENKQKADYGKFLDTPQLGKPPEKPDLIIESVKLPEKICVDEETLVSVTIRNVGWATAENPYVRLYVNNKMIEEKTLKIKLKPSETAKVEFKCKFTEKGKVKVRVVVNEVIYLIGPFNEVFIDNNEKIVEVEVKTPDLKIKNISYSPEKIEKCTKVKFKVEVENTGSCLARNFKVRLLILGKAGEGPPPTVYTNDSSVKLVEPGKTRTIEFEYHFEKPGKYIVKAIADPENKIVEEKEDDNEKEIEIEVVEREKLPDLGVKLIGPQTLYTDTLYRFDAIVTNYGEVEASTTVKLEISDGRVLESGVVLVPPGGSMNVTFFLKFSSPGTYTLTAIVDPYDTVRESNEENNVYEMYVAVSEKPLPDLIVSYLKVYYTIYTSGEYSYIVISKVDFTVTNAGFGESPGGIVVYIWVDDPENIIGQYEYPDELQSGGSFNYTLVLEYQTSYGTRTVGATVDPGNLIEEAKEDNNTTTVEISPTAGQKIKIENLNIL